MKTTYLLALIVLIVIAVGMDPVEATVYYFIRLIRPDIMRGK